MKLALSKNRNALYRFKNDIKINLSSRHNHYLSSLISDIKKTNLSVISEIKDSRINRYGRISELSFMFPKDHFFTIASIDLSRGQVLACLYDSNRRKIGRDHIWIDLEYFLNEFYLTCFLTR